MGKFKAIHAEMQEEAQPQHPHADMLCLHYPELHDYIQQAFDMGDEDKVYNLILSFKPENIPC